jgi:hypothetical protein
MSLVIEYGLLGMSAIHTVFLCASTREAQVELSLRIIGKIRVVLHPGVASALLALAALQC